MHKIIFKLMSFCIIGITLYIVYNFFLDLKSYDVTSIMSIIKNNIVLEKIQNIDIFTDKFDNHPILNYKFLIGLELSLISMFVIFIVFIIRGMVGLGKFSFAKVFNILRVYNSFSYGLTIDEFSDYVIENKNKHKKLYINLFATYCSLVFLMLFCLIYIITHSVEVYNIIFLFIPLFFIFIPKELLDPSIVDEVIFVKNSLGKLSRKSSYTAYHIFPHVELAE